MYLSLDFNFIPFAFWIRFLKASLQGQQEKKLIKVTESGRVATWMDETVSHICGKLEHTATLFSDLANDR